MGNPAHSLNKGFALLIERSQDYFWIAGSYIQRG